MQDANPADADEEPDGFDGFVCGTIKPTGSVATAYHINAVHDGVQAFDDLALPLCKRWSASFTGATSYPVVAGGRLYVTVALSGNQYGTNLYALDAKTGGSLWGPIALGGIYWWRGRCGTNPCSAATAHLRWIRRAFTRPTRAIKRMPSIRATAACSGTTPETALGRRRDDGTSRRISVRSRLLWKLGPLCFDWRFLGGLLARSRRCRHSHVRRKQHGVRRAPQLSFASSVPDQPICEFVDLRRGRNHRHRAARRRLAGRRGLVAREDLRRRCSERNARCQRRHRLDPRANAIDARAMQRVQLAI